jgi:predicted RNase H-like HicB family nuclease
MDLDPKTQNSILKQAGLDLRYAVLFEKTDTGYSAHVPDLPGCVAAGSTLEETTDLIRGAIRLHLAGIAEDGEAIPQPKTIAEYVVAA